MKWRLLCVAITLLALFLVFRKVSPATLLQTIRAMHVGWFIAGVALYGTMFLPAAVRWRIALRANDAVVSWPATFRFTVIGHFFYLILFGGTGGDVAKATVYARRHQLPLPKLFASVWLDRLMGSGALLIVAATAFAIAALHGGFTRTQSPSIRGGALWLLPIIPAFALLLLWLRRSRHESFLRRLAVAFLEGAKRLIKAPKRLAAGFVCSLLMQCAVNGLLALNLQAVSHTPVPWLRLLWTFPLITTISGLPVTVAGIGARDGAAIALLGWCGVPTADAEAMSLLTLCVSLLWGFVGGTFLWLESGKITRQTQQSEPRGSEPL